MEKSSYWDKVWDRNDAKAYKQYLKNYENVSNIMTETFKEHGCVRVCDCACGFGANSLILLSNGFDVYGFDISEESVWITTNLLSSHGVKPKQYKRASLTDTGYEDDFFDAVAVRAALDHLSVKDFNKALWELKRITKENGLLYASFDCLEEDDSKLDHDVLEDGSFLYSDENREGLLFHYYTDDELRKAFSEHNILHLETDKRGNRHIIIQF